LVLATATLTVATSFSAHAQARQRAVYVSVTDDVGNAIENRGPADFTVREDKTTREIANVTKAIDPIQIALLIDNTQSADGVIRDYRKAIAAFINGVAADTPAGGGKHQMAI